MENISEPQRQVYVSRVFGNIPPHKTGARLRNNSVIQALVASSSQHRTMKVKSEKIRCSNQSKQSSILHVIAGAHEKLGYCQGIDYVVTHVTNIIKKQKDKSLLNSNVKKKW